MENVFDFFNNLFSYGPNILEYTLHPSGVVYTILQVVFILVSATLLINIFFLIKLSSWYNWKYKYPNAEFYGYKPLEAEEISRKWAKVKERVKSRKESEYKLAVLEADDLLSDALKMDGYTGKNLEEQLGKVDSADIADTKPIMEAHELRNEIVKNPEAKISFDDADKAVKAFEKGYEELQAY